jgi:hypothetical protein
MIYGLRQTQAEIVFVDWTLYDQVDRAPQIEHAYL